MSKSIRSKQRRKMRAVKRARNAPKELAKLKSTLGISSDSKVSAPKLGFTQDIDAKKTSDEKKMEVETVRTYNKKTMRDSNGHYAPWLKTRDIKKIQNKLSATKKAKKPNKKVSKKKNPKL